MLGISKKSLLRISALLTALVAFLWLWHFGKSLLIEHGLRELTSRLKSRILTVTPSATVVVQKLQALSRLETARFVSQHLVEVKSESTWLPSFLAGEKLLLVAQVEVVSGIDMSEISPSDIQVSGVKVTIILPEPKIFSVKIDESGTRVFLRERGWLVFNLDKDLERQARMQAINEAKQAALREDLISFARQRAEENLSGFLRVLGFKEIEILWRSQQREITKRGEFGNG
ncbi:MAG: DUF4230 domain-containing protein [Candidatus Fervidibacter sp.]|uniref:DUF4230 domain-containing protein n=1 Tax=Candidatus Fervidibacter sp. TaxID=3100871 RepID=UPI004049F673